MTIQLKRGNSAKWNGPYADHILMDGEPAWNSDTKEMVVGDGKNKRKHLSPLVDQRALSNYQTLVARQFDQRPGLSTVPWTSSSSTLNTTLIVLNPQFRRFAAASSGAKIIYGDLSGSVSTFYFGSGVDNVTFGGMPVSSTWTSGAALVTISKAGVVITPAGAFTQSYPSMTVVHTRADFPDIAAQSTVDGRTFGLGTPFQDSDEGWVVPITYGDYNVNTGPLKVYGIALGDDSVVTLLSNYLNEQISHYRLLRDGYVVAVGVDPKFDPGVGYDQATLATNYPDGIWKKMPVEIPAHMGSDGPAPLVHIFDVAQTSDGTLFVCGVRRMLRSEGNPDLTDTKSAAVVWRSEDAGITWTEDFKILDGTSGFCRFYMLGQIGDRLFVNNPGGPNSPAYVSGYERKSTGEWVGHASAEYSGRPDWVIVDPDFPSISGGIQGLHGMLPRNYAFHNGERWTGYGFFNQSQKTEYYVDNPYDVVDAYEEDYAPLRYRPVQGASWVLNDAPVNDGSSGGPFSFADTKMFFAGPLGPVHLIDFTSSNDPAHKTPDNQAVEYWTAAINPDTLDIYVCNGQTVWKIAS